MDLWDFIDHAELVDLQLAGDSFTGNRGRRTWFCSQTGQIPEERETSFKNIKQSTLQRVTSDHCPLILECGNWERSNSTSSLRTSGFKENFKEMMKNRWDSKTLSRESIQQTPPWTKFHAAIHHGLNNEITMWPLSAKHLWQPKSATSFFSYVQLCISKLARESKPSPTPSTAFVILDLKNLYSDWIDQFHGVIHWRTWQTQYHS